MGAFFKHTNCTIPQINNYGYGYDFVTEVKKYIKFAEKLSHIVSLITS